MIFVSGCLDWLTYSIPAHPDFKKIEKDLTSEQGGNLEDQFLKNSTGKQRSTDREWKGVAELVAELKKLF